MWYANLHLNILGLLPIKLMEVGSALYCSHASSESSLPIKQFMFCITLIEKPHCARLKVSRFCFISGNPTGILVLSIETPRLGSCGSEPLVLTVSVLVLWCEQEQWAPQCSLSGETERHKTASQHLRVLPFSSPRCIWSPVGTRTINSSFWAALHGDGLKPSWHAAWGQEEMHQEPPHHPCGLYATGLQSSYTVILNEVTLLALLGHLDLLR